MSRPMAADGTISISTPSALAIGATADHRPAASTTDKNRSNHPAHLPTLTFGCPRRKRSEPHHHERRSGNG